MLTQFTEKHHDTIKHITCRIETPSNAGTGVILQSPRNSLLYFVTAKHCLLGKNYDQELQPTSVKIYIPSENGEFTSVSIDDETPILFPDDNTLDIAIIVLRNEAYLNIFPIPCLDLRFWQQQCLFRGYPQVDDSLQGINIPIEFVDTNTVTTQTPLETHDSDPHYNCEGFSGSGIFTMVDDKPTFLGFVYELKEPFHRFKIYNLSDINQVLNNTEFSPLPTITLPISPAVQKSVQSIEQTSKRVLDTINDKFNRQIHIRRLSVEKHFNELFSSNRVLLIKGVAGSGKSAFAKNQLTLLNNKGYKTLAFKADWFAKDRISKVFPNSTVDLDELLSFLGTTQKVIILIDSLEKLLEVDADYALKEFFQICHELPNIQILITCRNYAYQSLIFDLHYDLASYSFVDVPLLSNSEMDSVITNFPSLQSISNNPQFKDILRRSFYLDLAIRHLELFETDGILSELRFKALIWSHVIEKRSKTRGITLEKVALERATKMRLYVRLDDLNVEAAQELVQDGILEVDDYIGDAYRPSHDIYEDIALMRFVERAFQEQDSVENFFDRLGGRMPAKRRGFRLWLNDALIEPARISIFIQNIFESEFIAKFWLDEVIISILRSNYCEQFFEQQEILLLENEQALLLRFIHLLRTACQEPDTQLIQKVAEQDESLYQWIYLKPVGKGWEVIIRFIDKHFQTLSAHKPLFLRLLTADWAKKVSHELPFPSETKAAGRILHRVLEEAKWHFGSWRKEPYSEKEIKKGVELFLSLTQEFEPEIRNLVEEANIAKKRANDRYWRRERMFRETFEFTFEEEEKEEKYDHNIRKFHDTIIDFVLSGLSNQAICAAMPDLVCQVARDQWLSNASEPEHGSDPIMFRGIAFGLSDRNLNSFPSGIFKTPIRYLLYYHSVHALKLIVDVMNHCTDAYVKSKRGQNSHIVDVKILLNDGTTTTQKGNKVLWGMFRGMVEATHNLLQSILMSLESWLLELCQIDEPWAQGWIQITYEFLLKQSSTVATTAVLASVAQAHPHRLKELSFPILRVKEFFTWDINRMVGDQMPLAPADSNIPFAQEERHRSNQLPHRKYDLERLVTKLQIEGFDQAICKILDTHLENCDPNDLRWKLALNRMDARTFVVDETIPTPEENQVALRPALDDELREFVTRSEEEWAPSNSIMRITNWARSAYENSHDEGNVPFEDWNEAYQDYQKLVAQNEESSNLLYDPTYLAASGIKLFCEALSNEQKNWCIEVLFKALIGRVIENVNHAPYSIMSIQPAVETLPKILTSDVEAQIIQDVKQILFLGLLHLVTNKVEYPFEIFRQSIIWDIDPDYGSACIAGIIEFAKMRKQQRWFPPETVEAQQEREAFWKQQIDLAERVSTNKITLNLNSLSFDSHLGSYLSIATLIIPFNTTNKQHIELIRKVYTLHFEWQKQDNYERRQEDTHYEIQFEYKQYMAQLFLLADAQIAHTLFEEMLDDVFYCEGRLYDAGAFVADIIEQILIDQDSLQTESFWQLWTILAGRIRDSENPKFISYLLLSHKWWNSNADSWTPLKNKGATMQRYIEQFGHYNIEAVLQLLSGVGLQELMPQGINWLGSIANRLDNPQRTFAESKVFGYSEKLIQRTYYKFLREIKRDQLLQNNFLTFLDLMINQGSSLAFIVRDRLVTI